MPTTLIERSPRPPRFERVNVLSFELTPRDEEIVRIVGHNRFARSSHIIALLRAGDPSTSEQQIKRRLRLLFDAQYLTRPKIQVDAYRAGGGSRPMVYMLGNKGIDLLASKYGFRRASVDWTTKARSTTRLALDHALEVTDLMIAIEIACKGRGNLELIHFEDILRELAPADTKTNPRSYYWPVSVRPLPGRWKGREVATLYVMPDKIFGIKNLDLPEGRNRKFFYLEADRGTMPVVRPGLDKSSLLRKLIAYGFTYVDGLHRKYYGLPNFRVLGVVPSRERVDSVIAAHKQHTEHLMPAALCLVADRHSLFEAPDLFTYDWLDAAGQRHKLLD